MTRATSDLATNCPPPYHALPLLHRFTLPCRPTYAQRHPYLALPLLHRDSGELGDQQAQLMLPAESMQAGRHGRVHELHPRGRPPLPAA